MRCGQRAEADAPVPSLIRGVLAGGLPTVDTWQSPTLRSGDLGVGLILQQHGLDHPWLRVEESRNRCVDMALNTLGSKVLVLLAMTDGVFSRQDLPFGERLPPIVSANAQNPMSNHVQSHECLYS